MLLKEIGQIGDWKVYRSDDATMLIGEAITKHYVYCFIYSNHRLELSTSNLRFDIDTIWY
jgi:hypothetical protein